MIDKEFLNEVKKFNQQPLNRHAAQLLEQEGELVDPEYVNLFQLLLYLLESQQLKLNPSQSHLQSWVENLSLQPPKLAWEWLLGKPGEPNLDLESLQQESDPREVGREVLELLKLRLANELEWSPEQGPEEEPEQPNQPQ